MKGIAILGSTGSIGQSALEIVRANPDEFRVITLAAGKNITLLKTQVKEFSPRFVSVLNEEDAAKFRQRGVLVEVGFGMEGAKRAATYDGVDMVVSAIVGAAGFVPTLSAIMAGKDIALANKETLVIAGPLVMREIEKRGVNILPVDSEHSAVFQSIKGHRKEDIKRIILTASGGPFLNLPLKRLKEVTHVEALKHPTWSMGKRITIDSATLMNKGFEVIEAHWLFGVPMERITVCIHPQSVVHSMVEYKDGSIMAQMGSSDMKVPIAYALSYPRRLDSGTSPFSLSGRMLEFLEPDPRRFPCLAMAYEAFSYGESAPCVLNAADEVCVDAFLKGMIKFTDISGVIRDVLERHEPKRIRSIEDVFEADLWARKITTEIIKEIT